jgi:hypothetical protein
MSIKKTLAEKCEHIIETLKWFNLRTDKLAEELNKATSIFVPAYLDKYLIPLIPKLYKEKMEGTLWGNDQEMKFRVLISICFNGDLSQKAWDIVWSHLNDYEKIFYSTTYYHLGDPVEIAATHGNLDGLKRLDAIYQQLLTQYPKRHSIAQQTLIKTLRLLPKQMNNQQHVDSYNYLLDMCITQATLLNPNTAIRGFSNKQFNYPSSEQKTLLLDLFADLCVQYSQENDYNGGYAWAIKQLSLFVSSKGTAEDFRQFSEKLKDKLGDNYSEEKYVEDMQNNSEDLLPITLNLENDIFGENTDSQDNLNQTPPPSSSSLRYNLFASPMNRSGSKSESCFTSEQLAEIQARIDELQEQIDDNCCLSFWSNIDRKQQKINGLEHLIKIAKEPGMTIAEAIKQVESEKEFSELRSGIFSTKTATLLDELLASCESIQLIYS